MHMDPLLPRLVAILFIVVVLGQLLRRARQPLVVVYLLAGFVVGPAGFGLVHERETLNRLGEIGVLLLLFFVGMEVSLPRLIASWRTAAIGTALQIGASLGCAALVGLWWEWPIERSVLLGFVISLSSTAVVVKLLEDRREMDTRVGGDALGILLAQDLAVIPMLVVLGTLASGGVDLPRLGLQLGAGLVIIVGLVIVARRGPLKIPGLRHLQGDRELEIFAALGLCLGLALITALVGLSTVMGAFVAGILLSATAQTEWAHRGLQSFRVLLLAVFFLAIGTMVDLDFVVANLWAVLALTAAAFLTNTIINTLIFRVLGRTWAESIYGGALLSQVGEFSFVLAAVGLSAGIISSIGYQFTVSVISATLVLSSGWIALASRLVRQSSRSRRSHTPTSDEESHGARD